MLFDCTKCRSFKRGCSHWPDLLCGANAHSGNYANLFRATQTEEKLRKEKIKGKQKANDAHFEVGKKVRQAIKKIGGTMPEDLPVADSIKKLDNKKGKKTKKFTLHSLPFLI